MPLSWNEIKSRAVKFSKEWENETSESAESQTFLNEFFNIFGISRRRVAAFEKPVEKIDGREGYIDLLWPGQLLIEHKSRGRDLEKAKNQAIAYSFGLTEEELPRYILVCDFNRFSLHDIDEDSKHDFILKNLVKNVKLFSFIAGYQTSTFKDEDPVNIKAAEKIGKLHDKLKAIGYEGHALEVYLVRIVFCLFADDTNIFNKGILEEYIKRNTKEDGSDLAHHLSTLFHILNQHESYRLKNLDESLDEFPYVNGKLFEESLPPASFDSEMRNLLLDCCSLDWSMISPAIFGSMFQSVMNPEERRNLGAHYTSEKNILKVIKSLFLDELHDEFESIKNSKKKLIEFHKKLSTLKFLDPACGCGNFLVITYRELRLLEIEILRKLYDPNKPQFNIKEIVWVDIDQFYGIELEEWPARIAEVAMWLIDHQMNMRISEEFGEYFVRLPLKKSANIHNVNALRIKWESIVPKDQLSYILGNPPFGGARLLSEDARNDIKILFNNISGSGKLDYVTGWYIKASKYIQNTNIKVAFVSTNSISQGEQVGILWNELFNNYIIKIHFAHRTFKWSNEARGKAAVHVIIIGFANYDTNKKYLFEYDDVMGEPHSITVSNINPYLVSGKDILITSRTKPLCKVQQIIKGSETTDDGHFMLTSDEVNYLKSNYKESAKYIRPFIGGGDFINGNIRFCLWLKDASIEKIRRIPFIIERIERVKKFRLNSPKKRTRHWANFPTLFTEDRQPNSRYLLIPKISS